MINKSLATLGMVINNLTDGKSSHIPYRESKLTRVLQESLGGNAKTCLIITCSPSVYNEAETLSTLRFGLRAKKIKNKPKINKEVTIAELKLEIDKLERIVLTSNKRIKQLEDFIESCNQTIPIEDDYSFMDKKLTDPLSMSGSEGNLGQSNNNNDNGTTVIIDTINEIHERKVDELSKNYNLQLSNLETDKKDLSTKLDNAIARIRELSVAFEEKDKLINELNSIKINSDYNQIELFEKINEMQEKLDAKNNIVVNNNVDNTNIGNTGKGNAAFISNKNIECVQNKILDLINRNQGINGNEDINAIRGNINNELKDISQMLGQCKENLDINNSSVNNETYPSDNSLSLNLNLNDKSLEESNSSMLSDIKKEKKKHDHEKKIILKALQEKNEKVSSKMIITKFL
jgi:kinesin family protein 5